MVGAGKRCNHQHYHGDIGTRTGLSYKTYKAVTCSTQMSVKFCQPLSQLPTLHCVQEEEAKHRTSQRALGSSCGSLGPSSKGGATGEPFLSVSLHPLPCLHFMKWGKGHFGFCLAYYRVKSLHPGHPCCLAVLLAHYADQALRSPACVRAIAKAQTAM